MNRSLARGLLRGRCVPRRRGDEPRSRAWLNPARSAFPAGAGMNRPLDGVDGVLYCVPRRRGDEPALGIRYRPPYKRSPQARG